MAQFEYFAVERPRSRTPIVFWPSFVNAVGPIWPSHSCPGSGLPMLVVALLSTGSNIGSELDVLLQRRYGRGYIPHLLDVRAHTDHGLVLSSRVFPNRHGRQAGHFSGSSLFLWLQAVKVIPGS